MSRWLAKGGRYGILASAALLLAGCAGGFSDDHTITRITTDPPRARCTLHGKGFSQIVQTPVRVVLPKESAPITVSCSGTGYRDFVTTLKPQFNGQVLGNLLTGSVMGLVVDLTHGHDLKFPSHIQINMEPTIFRSVEARDRWFNRYREQIVKKWTSVVDNIGDACHGSDADSAYCQAKMRTAKKNQARELGLLEHRRRNARIGHVDTAEQVQPAAK